MRSTNKTLTARQNAIVAFLREQLSERGYGPTVREIGARFGITSPNGVMCHLKALEKKGVIRRDRRCARSITLDEMQPRANVPLSGVVRAGRPVLAEELNERIDFSDLFSAGVYALKVDGDSMTGEGIMPGDTVLVRKSDTASGGDLVVAMADGEQTVKRLAVKGRRTLLVPANPEMEPWEPDELEILGVVIGVVRRV
jgi:repressor LexA